MTNYFAHDPRQHQLRQMNDASGLAQDLFEALTTIPEFNLRLTTKTLDGVSTTLHQCILAVERLPPSRLALFQDQILNIRKKTSEARASLASREQSGIPEKVIGVRFEKGSGYGGYSAQVCPVSGGVQRKYFTCGSLGEADRTAHAKAVAWRRAKQAEIDKVKRAKKKNKVKTKQEQVKNGKLIRARERAQKAAAKLK